MAATATAAQDGVVFNSTGPAEGMLDLIGGTPLVRLRRLYPGAHLPRLLTKLELANPGGSSKDRSAASMLSEALRRGELRRGDTVIESSSGNLGVALAQCCAWEGLRFVCVVDPRTNTQTLRMIEAYGAELHHVTDPDPDTGDWLIARRTAVRSLLRSTPRSWCPDQYANRMNPQAHAEGTMKEIAQALDGQVAAVVVATSTTGTLVGCQRYIASAGLTTQLIAVDACGSVLFGGARGTRLLPGFGAGTEPALARSAAPDRVVRVSDLECVIGCRRMAQREALLVGASTGGIISALHEELARFGPQDTVVFISHDSGSRYLDTVFDDTWVERHLGCPPQQLQALIEGGSRAA